MEKVKAKLIKPLDGKPEGSEVEFEKRDFDRLVAKGAVVAVKAEKTHENKAAASPENKAKGRK